MNVLVTGGAGYIGSHTIVELLENGHDVVAIDNLANSSLESLRRIEHITHRQIIFEKIDIGDKHNLSKLFLKYNFDSVIHFAGLKSVTSSINDPLAYYHTNLISLITLCEVMAENKIKRLIFSSSATVYGKPSNVPITEDSPLAPTNPYGQTKAMGEQILTDFASANPSMEIVILRYFNPVGAHPSGLIGEHPKGIPNNLLPFISQVAVGKIEKLIVTGNDFETNDGTGVRDYIHVQDLAKAHVKAMIAPVKRRRPSIYNIGTGRGYSVLEMVKAFERASGRKVPYVFAPRRPGDIGTCYADPSRANRELGWVAKKNLEEICADAWRWQSRNPKGYEGD